jgi:hypothetical protein
MLMKNSRSSRTAPSRAATAWERTFRQIFGCFSRERYAAAQKQTQKEDFDPMKHRHLPVLLALAAESAALAAHATYFGK